MRNNARSNSEGNARQRNERDAIVTENSTKNFAEIHHNGIMRFVIVLIGMSATTLVFLYPLHAFLLPRIIYFFFLVLLICEMQNLLPPAMKPHFVLSLCAGLLFPMAKFVAALTPTFKPYQYRTCVFILAFFVVVLSFLIIRRTKSGFVDTIVEKIGGVLFLVVYPGLLSSFFIMLPDLTGSIIHMVLVTGIVYCNDGCAYLCGRFFGKKGENPLIYTSPGKTCIGFLGGMVGGLIFFALVYFMKKSYFPGNFIISLLFAVCVNVAGMLGDLFESAVKRAQHCKDSGSIMLGRGGVLDTFDSLLFASVVYYILYPIFY